jgi:glycosyltransferase involved in cell wall biosynthesis
MTAAAGPRISVYLPTHDRLARLQRAVASVLAQVPPPHELIVVDDGSSDGTADWLAEQARAGRLRWHRHDVARGACAARNRAIALATGELVTGIDDDDEWLPGRLAALRAALRPDRAFACASDRIVDAHGHARLRVSPPRIGLQALLGRNLVGNQVLVERERVLACGGFDETLAAAQDYDLWLRLVRRYGDAVGIGTPLQQVHAADADRISVSPARRRAYWRVFRKHRAAMGAPARRNHLFGLLRIDGRLTPWRLRRLWGDGVRLRVLAYRVGAVAPGLARALDRLGAAWLRRRGGG